MPLRRQMETEIMPKQVQYRLRTVTRYVVTRYESEVSEDRRSGTVGTSEQRGEYDNAATAYAVAYALCKAEHDAAGAPPGSMDFIYPEEPARAVSTQAACIGNIYA